MAKGDYDPETYWSRVAEEVDKRGANDIAGDDNPYYVAKRRRFLREFLDKIDFRSKIALEVGSGLGGNLEHIARHHAPSKLLGADVSQKMIDIASKTLASYPVVELTKINGAVLPFADKSVDVSYTATVLHHNTDETTFRSLVRELCRVTKTTVVLMEDIGTADRVGGTGDFVGRTVRVYESLFREQGFKLVDIKFLNMKVSRTWHWLILGLYRQVIVKRHREGEKMASSSRFLIGLPLPLTRLLDRLIPDNQDLAKMVFERA